MSPIVIYAVIGVIIVSVIISIPFLIANSKKKKKEEAFVKGNTHNAILRIYGESITVDGSKPKELNSMRGENMEPVISLPAGQHLIRAKYATTSVGLGSNVNYKTPDHIETEVILEAGHEYSIGIYFYTPEERSRYYEGDTGKDISTQVLSIGGTGAGGYSKAYVVCYEEK